MVGRLVNDLLNQHPVIGPIAIIAAVWAMTMVTAIVFFILKNPDIDGADNVAMAVIGLFGLAFLNLRKLKGVE